MNADADEKEEGKKEESHFRFEPIPSDDEERKRLQKREGEDEERGYREGAGGGVTRQLFSAPVLITSESKLKGKTLKESGAYDISV
jgi:hypothetical protein